MPRIRRAQTAALALVAATVLSGCALEPVAGWTPPPARVVPGVVILDPGAPDSGAGDAEAAPAVGPQFDSGALGLVGGRLYNTALPFSARFVYIPGAPAFNERVNQLLWSTIAATGVPYAPQVHAVEAGLADRGCVAGSTSWPAADVLTRPETGPSGSAGTAVTCEVTGAFGSTVEVALRVVTGTPDAVTGDTAHALSVNLATGEVGEGVARWSAEAPAELWRRAVELLRQEAGGLSSAQIAAPDEAQLALAGAALRAAVNETGGGVRVTLPAGLAAPELIGLGVPATDAPLELVVDPETALGWSTEEWRLYAEQLQQPFAGVTAAPTSVPIDCALIPCVALTYDDGPSAFTPQLLDTLAQHGASATFYMLGPAAAGSPDTVRRVAAEGHEIGSHTMGHPDLTKIPVAAARAEVLDAATLLRQISGLPVATFRPPYGAVNGAVIAAVGMPAIMWSVDTNDWRRPGIPVVVDRAVNGVAPGGIVLFHDTHSDSVAAAADIITGLRNRGFEPVTVTELFGGAVPGGRVSSR